MQLAIERTTLKRHAGLPPRSLKARTIARPGQTSPRFTLPESTDRNRMRQSRFRTAPLISHRVYSDFQTVVAGS